MNKFKVLLSILCVFLFQYLLLAQSFTPEPEVSGSDAIHKDSSIFINWANEVSITRGPLNIQDPNLGLSNYGAAYDASFIADNNVVSLGDGGQAIATFTEPISNGEGPDFAIFENGFANHYMELAFVEVSSDGINFIRFESVSETPTTTQLDNFSFSDCRYIHNLAGKYRVYYGTPFDLEDVSGINGLDINNITHVKIIDVIGSVTTNIGSYDSQGNIINDPYPTPFESGGFDLDAIGVIHSENLGLTGSTKSYVIFPNPVHNTLNMIGFPNGIKTITNAIGKEIISTRDHKIDVRILSEGIYFIQQGKSIVKFVKE